MLLFIGLLVIATLVAPVVYLNWKEQDEEIEALIQCIQAQGQAFDDLSADLTECLALVKETESNRAYTQALQNHYARLSKLAYLSNFDDVSKEEILEAVKNPH